MNNMEYITVNGSATIGYLYEHFENMREPLEGYYKFNKDFIVWPGYKKILVNGKEVIRMRPYIKANSDYLTVGLIHEDPRRALKRGDLKLNKISYIAKLFNFPGDFDVNQFYEHKVNDNE